MLISGFLEVIKKNDIKKKKTSVAFLEKEAVLASSSWTDSELWEGRVEVRFEAALNNALK